MYLQTILTKNANFEDHKEFDVVYGNNLLSGYTDVTDSISGWFSHGENSGKDYKFVRKQIQDLITDFDLLSASDKILAGKFMAPNPATIFDSGVLVDYEFYKKEWIRKSKESRIKRWEAFKSLTFGLINNNKTFLAEIICDDLHDEYIEGIESMSLDGVDGVFDFVESTSVYSATGFINGGYTASNPPQTITQISVLFMNILKNGNY